MHRRAVLGAVAVLAAVDVALWFAVFNRSTSPATSSGGGGVADSGRVAASSPNPSASTASAAPPAKRPSESPSAAESPDPEPPGSESPPPEGSDHQRRRVEVTSDAVSGAAFETVPIRGVLHGARENATLRVQHQQRGRWTSFPLPTTTDSKGRFTAYVEIGAPGKYRLRVLDPRTGSTSPVVLLTVQ